MSITYMIVTGTIMSIMGMILLLCVVAITTSENFRIDKESLLGVVVVTGLGLWQAGEGLARLQGRRG